MPEATSHPGVEAASPDPAVDRGVLGWAIAAMVLCFLPLGIAAVVLALRAQAADASGDHDLAVRRRRAARRFTIAALVVGVVVYAVILAVLALLGAF